MRRPVSVVLLALAASCASAPDRELVLEISKFEDGSCPASLNGKIIENDSSLARFSELRRDHDAALIIAASDTEYRCIGAVIFDLQRAGFKKVSFNAGQ